MMKKSGTRNKSLPTRVTSQRHVKEVRLAVMVMPIRRPDDLRGLVTYVDVRL